MVVAMRNKNNVREKMMEHPMFDNSVSAMDGNTWASEPLEYQKRFKIIYYTLDTCTDSFLNHEGVRGYGLLSLPNRGTT
jgi:rRNA pseudouridine-1189 N-methylase Emg1 (Nep1/Mra1 family)